jgi:hypothetical protein
MPTHDLVVQANIGPGTITSPWFALPLGLKISDIALVSSAWPDPTLLVSLRVERSYDGGATGQFWFGWSGTGAQSYDRAHNPIMPRFGARLTGSEPQMHVRASVTLNKRIRIGVQGITG